MSPTSGKLSAKYKKQKLSSEVLAEILRSDEEDELVEFINNSFTKSGPSTSNNNKKRTRTSNRHKDEAVMHEIDLSANGLAPKGNISKYDLSSNGESIIVGDRPRNKSRIFITFGLFVSFFGLVSTVTTKLILLVFFFSSCVIGKIETKGFPLIMLIWS